MRKIEVGSQEWLEIRKNYITATDLPVIMGISPWKSPQELYEEKIGECPPAPSNAWMDRGIELEPEARHIFETRFATLVDPQWVVSPEIEWAAASLDGWDGGNTLVEIKCPGKKNHDIAKKGEIPNYYYPQIQWQMMVTMQQKAWYVSYRPEDINHFVAMPVKRDQAYIDEMIEKAAEFYESIKHKTPLGWKNLNSSSGAIMITDEECLVLEKELYQTLSRRREEDERIEFIKQQLIKSCNGQKGSGKYLTITPVERKGAVNYASIPQIKEMVETYGEEALAPFRKPSTTIWRVDQIHADL